MSFLGDIVNSIGGSRVPDPPKPPSRPLSTDTSRQSSDINKPPSQLAVTSHGNGLKRKPEEQPQKPQGNGLKRKPEELPQKPQAKVLKVAAAETYSNVTKAVAMPSKGALKPTSETKGVTSKSDIKHPTRVDQANNQTGSNLPSSNMAAKAPAKGSYADIMERAKQAADQKKENQVGMIKHQSSNREKVSKMAERKREEQERAKGQPKSSIPRSGSRDERGKKRSISPHKTQDKPQGPKVARPPLHVPQSGYKGTMGASSSRAKFNAKSAKSGNSRRYDEYLGTDEEDDSDLVDDEVDGYGSEASSDMEADTFELDQEEQRALKAAKQEDARELALENQMKQEKEDRRRRLENLAGKRK